MKDNRKIKVGITQGDINGIGYEVILKALDDPRFVELCTPVIYGSAKIAAYYRKGLDIAPVNLVQVPSADDARDGDVNIINVVPEDTKIEPGVASKTAGQAAFASLESAVADLRSGSIDVLVTAPINKDTIQSETFTFPGHTEYLEASIGDGDKSLMVLCSDDIRVALVTAHMPLAKVPSAITKEAILEKLRIFNHSLQRDFAIDCPRIAVLSLTPHAGENGLLVVLVSDHGTSPSYDAADAVCDRFNTRQFEVILNSFLNVRYGVGDWLLEYEDKCIYLDHNLIYEKGLDLASVQNEVAAFAMQFRGVSHALSATAMRTSYFGSGYAEKMQNSFYPRRSGDVILNLMPGWIEKEEAVRSSSGSMYGYDTRVPLIVYRPGQTPRRVDRKVEMRAVAPTVARLLGVPEPAACEAEELREATGE